MPIRADYNEQNSPTTHPDVLHMYTEPMPLAPPCPDLQNVPMWSGPAFNQSVPWGPEGFTGAPEQFAWIWGTMHAQAPGTHPQGGQGYNGWHSARSRLIGPLSHEAAEVGLPAAVGRWGRGGGGSHVWHVLFCVQASWRECGWVDGWVHVAQTYIRCSRLLRAVLAMLNPCPALAQAVVAYADGVSELCASSTPGTLEQIACTFNLGGHVSIGAAYCRRQRSSARGCAARSRAYGLYFARCPLGPRTRIAL